jgi:hypothetical protein
LFFDRILEDEVVVKKTVEEMEKGNNKKEERWKDT